LIPTILVALALSMDAFAVSIASGICVADLRFRHALRASLSFGAFQFAMPIAGWLLGTAFRAYIQGLDHWIAFGLLAFVGGKMIAESFGARDPESCSDEEKSKSDIRGLRTLLLLSVATSVDALAVGLSYSVLGSPILEPAAVIGATTFALCLAGTEFGRRIGARFERWATLAGGVVLLGLGARILLEHAAKGI
jgi:manganese efflux pump family protein